MESDDSHPPIDRAIFEAATGPQSVTVDGIATTVDVGQQIQAARFLAAKRAARSPLKGIGITRIYGADHR